jgi:hypothetical protein
LFLFGELDLAADAGDVGLVLPGTDGDVVVEAGDEAEKFGGLFGQQSLERGGIEVLEGLLHEGGQEAGQEVGQARAGFRPDAG